ncbi:DUF2793 domain-containing protein [Paracoccus sp. J55]|uniref:DUF2793 domain-containing protein n=1 Tax=Paracoccus sp. J55 TaxID=935849 RepID=UPI00048A8B45|nr:DUF2793 domain-containing protein [Paracoccus sp. J55]
MANSANLALPYLAASQAQKHVTHNEALRLLDGIVQLSAADRGVNTPPGSPAEGACYIVGGAPTGAWAGWGGNIAMWADGAWLRLVPKPGWTCWVQDEGMFYVHNGAGWVTLASTLGL